MVHLDFEVVEDKGFGNFSIKRIEHCLLINDCKYFEKVPEELCIRGEYKRCEIYKQHNLERGIKE